MKFSIIFAVVFLALAAAESPPKTLPPFLVGGDPSQEGIFDGFKDFGKAALKGLKEIAKTAGKDLLGKAVEIFTDGLRLKPTKEAQESLHSGPSTEGIFGAIGDLILKRANQLSQEEASEVGPSHEGIVANFGPFYKIYEAENPLYYQYNKSYHTGDEPSHEGIIGDLGGLALKGLGGLIGGSAGNVIGGVGDFLGNLFFALPAQSSQEGIIDILGSSGILSSAGELIVKGAAKAGKTLLKGLFKPITDLLQGSIFIARGNYKSYPNFQAPGQEAIDYARSQIHQYPEAQKCIASAERNLTQLYDEYVKNGHGCIAAGQNDGHRIISHVYDIVLDAVQKVEDVHREAGNCFYKQVDENKIACLDHHVPAQIAEHSQTFINYGKDLSNFVRDFSDVNNNFDICLTRHLGDVRREIYHIVYDFHKCFAQQKPKQSQKKI